MANTKLEKVKEYIIPILSFLLSVATFFAGRWMEVKNFELEKVKLQAQQSNTERELQLKTIEIQNLQDKNQKDLQFKYVELLTQNLDEKHLMKAELIIHLIENPNVKASFSQITQNLVDQVATDEETKNSIKANFANVTFDARQKIQNNREITSEVIEQQHEAGNKITSAQEETLEKFDEEDMLTQSSKRSLYQELINLLEELRNQTVITDSQSQKYVNLHLEILNNYADDAIKASMVRLFEARKNLTVDASTKGLMDEVIRVLKNDLSKTLWCKENYFINWKGVKCNVLDVNKEEGFVRVDLISLKDDSVIAKDLKLEVGKPHMIPSVNASLELVKIDKAGKNFLKLAGFFKFVAQS